MTEKVALRDITKEDKSRLETWLNDTDINQYLDYDRMSSEHIENEWYGPREEMSVYMVVAEKTVIGAIRFWQPRKIDRLSGRAHITIVIGEKNLQGKGIGSQALTLALNVAFSQEGLNLDMILADIFDFNQRSIALFERMGFKKNASRKNFTYKKGRWLDESEYILTKETWRRSS